MATSVDAQLLEFGRVLENSLAEIYIFDAESLRFVLVNRGARENLGYSMDELQRLTPLDLKPEFTEETFAELVRPLRIGEQQAVGFETIHRRKDGSSYPVQVKLDLSNFKDRLVFVATILDTTEHKRSEREARASEARFRSYFNLGLIGTAVTSPTKGWVEVNDKLCEILGYSRDELVQKTWAELTYPDDLAADVEQFDRVLAGKIDGYSMDKRFVRRDGRVIDASIDVQCLRNEDNSVDQFVALVQDISDRKDAERALRRANEELEGRVAQRTKALKESEERFRAFMDNSPTIAWLKDEQGHFVYLSRTYEQHFGVRLEDCLGKTDFDLWPKEIAEEFRRNDVAVLSSGQVLEVIEQAPQPDGTLCDRLNFKFPFEDASGTRYVGGIGIDLTERKRAEDSLRQSEERFRLAARATNDALYDCDLVAGTVWWNEQLDRLFGERSKETNATWQWWKDRIHADDRRRVVDSINTAIDGRANDGNTWTEEYRFRRSDGNYAFVVDRAYIARDAEGNATRLLGAIQDVTERKQAQEQLLADRDLLQNLIDLQEAERRMIAHDIHDGFVQDVVGAHMQIQCLEDITDANVLASTVTRVEALLQKAIAEGRRLIRDTRPMVLDERGIVEAIRHLVADEKGQADLVVAYEHDVRFDRLEARLEGVIFRIVQEALSNVRRHAQTGHAAVRMTQHDGLLEIIVRDHGVGFDPDKVTRGGFGLLGIRERARLYGGSARIASAPGEGTKIHVELPLRQED